MTIGPLGAEKESGVRKHPEVRVSGCSKLQGRGAAGMGEAFGLVWTSRAILLAPNAHPSIHFRSGPAQGA